MRKSGKRYRRDGNIIFRRYRRLPNGRILDAYDYGFKAWPIRIG